jgi:hypothetical protein
VRRGAQRDLLLEPIPLSDKQQCARLAGSFAASHLTLHE